MELSAPDVLRYHVKSALNIALNFKLKGSHLQQLGVFLRHPGRMRVKIEMKRGCGKVID